MCVPFAPLLTLLLLLGLAHPLGLASAAMFTPDSQVGPVVTAVPINSVTLSGGCRSKLREGISQGERRKELKPTQWTLPT